MACETEGKDGPSTKISQAAFQLISGKFWYDIIFVAMLSLHHLLSFFLFIWTDARINGTDMRLSYIAFADP